MDREESAYDRRRITEWMRGRPHADGLTRRDFVRLSATAGIAVGAGLPGGAALSPGTRAAEPPSILKPTPEELFYRRGTNAEMRWEAMRGQGLLVPTDRFFVRNHTRTPVIDVDSWRLRLFGTGLRGTPTPANPVELTYRELRRLPAHTLTAFIECAGNGRSLFTTQQNQVVSGTAWRLGAVGVATWRGVRLATVLRKAGLTPTAVDVMPQGMDPDYTTGAVNLGRVRRALPVTKALSDVLLAYEMNGETLPPDHGFPVRVVVPSWVGISSIKWVDQIEVSDTPLYSPWNTEFYRLFGPGYPADGVPVDRQVVKSAFELPWNGQLAAGQRHLLHGRSWSGNGAIRRVEVSTDEGTTWHPARLTDVDGGQGWQCWQFGWLPPAPGPHTLRARATDQDGILQPDTAPYNTQGYLFGAVVRHPVMVG